MSILKIDNKVLDKKSAKTLIFSNIFLRKSSIKLIEFEKGENMEIVLEYVFLQNLFIDYLIFRTTEGILKIKGCHIVLISMFASIISLILPIFYLPKFAEFIIKIFLGILLVSLAFKFKSFLSFLKIFLTFLFSTFLYGGVCACFVETFGSLSTILILAIVVSAYLIFKWLLKYINKRKNIENFCYDCILKNGKKTLNCKGFLDTGNMLVDPLTQKPVCIVGLKLFKELGYDLELKDILTQNFNLKDFTLGHYIFLDTVGSGGKVLAFEIDELCVKGKEEFEKPMLALCLKNFPNYEIILNNCFV